ncbi:MAG TPA: epoxyqueuosine reductase QueH [Candidatus Monoglobus merdigallinarum]|uniref:Epoxyqueuosine reductase QueH n=1 Tax=Candidatus Monoglobus merdigallinarum TaxID=2838698 RepID=A0A9D1PPY7_9FIRM|nr:epoxyqueuosine reductase QueH [Candidatus Monoglobus merdigallinarum]
MNKINYQRELDKIINEITESGDRPKLLLHSCCAPCSSYVLSYLCNFFDITVLYYNPNITEPAEYQKRKAEQLRLIRELPFDIGVMDCEHESEKFFETARGLEACPEGGERCFKCYRLRLEKTAACAGSFDYFCTTLSISPLKNARKINEIGSEIGEKYGVKFLPSDFKKKDGFKKSILLSHEYNLYRQNYCGCVYSKKRTED